MRYIISLGFENEKKNGRRTKTKIKERKKIKEKRMRQEIAPKTKELKLIREAEKKGRRKIIVVHAQELNGNFC